MTLTDLAIKRARPAQKIIKLSDGGGLQWWRRAALTRPLAKL
jgi:hypothetical protein